MSSPIVGVLGARQSGKTTLLKQYASETRTFDDPRLVGAFDRSGENLLEAAEKPFFLDEVQKYPPIFDLLKLVGTGGVDFVIPSGSRAGPGVFFPKRTALDGLVEKHLHRQNVDALPKDGLLCGVGV